MMVTLKLKILEVLVKLTEFLHFHKVNSDFNLQNVVLLINEVILFTSLRCRLLFHLYGRRFMDGGSNSSSYPILSVCHTRIYHISGQNYDYILAARSRKNLSH